MKVLYKIKSIISGLQHKGRPLDGIADFSIISCNCIGGLLYHDYGRKFLSPTINLYINSPDFIKFALNLEKYLNYELIEVKNRKYPIGKLGDILVHFLHYDTFAEAKTKWEERKKRVIYDNIFIIMTDRDEFDEKLLKDFEKITFKKVLFSHKKLNIEDCVYVKKDFKKDMVDDLTKYIDFKGTRVYDYYFDFDKWFTGNFKTKECIK